MTGEENRGPAQYGAFAAMCLIWGTTFLAIRVGNEAVPPLWAAFIRLALAMILNLLVALATRAAWPRGAALQGIAQFGLLNLGINFALLYWGEQRVPSGIAALIAVFTAATCASLSAVILKRVPPHSTFVVNGVGAAGGSCVCLAGSFLLGESHALP